MKEADASAVQPHGTYMCFCDLCQTSFQSKKMLFVHWAYGNLTSASLTMHNYA